MTAHVTTDRFTRIRRKLLAWFNRRKRDLPWRRTRDPYAIWLSEMMLQQTQVATVVPYYHRFLDRFPTVRDLARADLDAVLGEWAGLGYYARARNLHKAAQVVHEKLAGEFPRTAEGLRALPGIGPYTAGAIASIAFDAREPLVDGNVARVFARLFHLQHDVRDGRGRDAVWELAEQLLPKRRCGDFNEALMELGALVCLPGAAAKCEACPLRGECPAYEAGDVAELPARTRKTQVRDETHVVAAIEQAGAWLVVRRAKTGLWGGLWELPTAVLNGRGSMACAKQIAAEHTDAACRTERQSFCDLTHQLTHRKIRFVGHVCRMAGRKKTNAGQAGSSAEESRWMKLASLDELGMSRAMRRVIEALQGHLA